VTCVYDDVTHCQYSSTQQDRSGPAVYLSTDSVPAAQWARPNSRSSGPDQLSLRCAVWPPLGSVLLLPAKRLPARPLLQLVCLQLVCLQLVCLQLVCIVFLPHCPFLALTVPP